MKDYIFFWGCTIPGRFPFLEKSLRLVLERLGVKYREIEGFTCCPEKFLVETMSEEAWYLTAARNLALAEREGCDLLVACNGCYSTFRSAMGAFHASSELRERVSKRLKEVGLDFKFKTSVSHVVEVLHDSIGPEVIARKVELPLDGIELGVHYGCQLIRPSPTVRFDNPLRPGKLDRLVECLGATSLYYNTKLNCCGESLARTGNAEDSMASARLKLLELNQLGADAIVVVCPACFQQYDSQQLLIKKHFTELHLPVFYYTELLGIALGLEPGEMGVEMHRVDVEPFFDTLKELRRKRDSIPRGFDWAAMKTCVECGSCYNDCPVTQVDDTFEPHEVLFRILEGQVDQVIEGDEIWKCLECGTCTELCPNSFGMMKVFKQAKRMALKRGIVPAETRQGIDMFRKTGTLGNVRKGARSRLGLGEVGKPGSEQLEELLGDTMNEGD